MQMTAGQQTLLTFAFVLFILSGWSRWWPGERPWYPSLVSLGLACWVASILFGRYL